MTETLRIGFLPLVDACLPILAQEHGFAEEEGITLEFQRDVSWATVLDRLLYGQTDAAHMLAPLAIATTLGKGRPAKALSAPFVLGLNGNAVTVSISLAEEMGVNAQFGNPVAVGESLRFVAQRRHAEGKPLRFGVVHRYSSHNYMLRYWLASCGVPPDDMVEAVTVPPPFAAEALANGEIDGVCVGEPWNSIAVQRGVGQIVLATSQIWRRGVEKVLAMREPVMEERRGSVEPLIRAMRKAGAHFVNPDNWGVNAGILARSQYLDAPADLILAAISDTLVLRQGGDAVNFPDFMFQYSEAANFPWVSQAQWIYTQLVRWERSKIDPLDAEKAARVFRPDVYRSALAGTGDILPGASSKVEGSLEKPTSVTAQQGAITLTENRFFDGRVFDPDNLENYLDSLR